jgi:hypothetical protein
MTMRVEQIKKTIAEARRFLELADHFEFEERHGTGAMAGHSWKEAVTPSRINAAIRRASLDLSNALADLRKG